MGEMIEFAANGGTLGAYLASPEEGDSNGRGVIVLQEWWGLVPHIVDVADRFAAAGYTALAPDLYHGDSTTNPDDAGRLFMALNIERAIVDLRAAASELKKQGGIIGKVGVVGFCMGGQLALLAATTATDDIGAAVDFYGIHPNVKPDFSTLAAPVIGFFGEDDAFVPPDAVKQLVRDIEAAGKSIEHHVYTGAGHAFFNDDRPDAFCEDAANDAWTRTHKFFSEHLAGTS